MNTNFLNLSDFPAADALARDLCAQADELTTEALDLVVGKSFTLWPEKINGGGWEVCGVKWQGAMLKNAAPIASAIVGRHGAHIVNAGYSLMNPGTEIAPHVGYTNEVIRLHVGLYIPPPEDGSCALVVGGESMSWQKGKALLFDDTIMHSAHNRTTFGRIIFLADILRQV